MVHGELKHETFDGADGHKHSSLDLKADAIGLNLRFCAGSYAGPGARSRSISASGQPETHGTTDVSASSAAAPVTADTARGDVMTVE